MTAKDRQVYPLGDVREHVTDGSPCWCHPRIVVLCTQCGEPTDPSCWKCGGEGIVDTIGHADPDVPTISIHNRTGE